MVIRYEQTQNEGADLMGLLDTLFGDDQQKQQQATAVDPNAINPIYGVPEALIQEMKREQQKADIGNAFANLFGGAANIARGAQGNAPIYEQAGTDPNAAMDGLAKRVMMFSQLRQNYEQQSQKQALNKMLPGLAQKLGIAPEVLSGLPDSVKQELALKAIQGNPAEQTTIDLPEGKITALKQRDPNNPTGFRYTTIDGQPLDMAQIAKRMADVKANEESVKAQGKAMGEKRAGLETTLSGLDNMNMMVQQVLDDPNLSKAVGAIWDRGMSYIPGTDAYGTGQRIEQLKSNAFLSSIAQMRGMGSLSNAEGMKVEAALGRLNSAQNEKDFRQSLADVQKSLGRLREVAMKEAGVSPQTSQTAGSDWQDMGGGIRIRRVQ